MTEKIGQKIGVFTEVNTPNKTSTLLFVVLLSIITFLTFLPCLSAYFVNIDDPAYLLNNNSLLVFSKEWSWETIGHFFTKEAKGNYIPFVNITYATEEYFFARDIQSSSFIFHLDNLLLHIGCTICVYFLFLKMNINKWGAFIGALLFGIHPMRVESVAWVTERKDVLYGLFFLLSLLAYINYIKSKGKLKWYFCALLFSLCSYFSKGQAVTLPLCMVALDIYFKKAWYAPKKLLLEKLPWWLLSLAFGFVSIYIISSQKIIDAVDAVAHYSLIDRLAMGAYTYSVYVVKFIYPYQMVAYYNYTDKLPVVAYIYLVLVPGLIIYTIWKGWRNVYLLFGLLFFTFNIGLMLQVLSSGDTFLADRYTYIAYIGFFFWVAAGYKWVMQRFIKFRKIIAICLSLYLVLFMFMNYNQNKIWQNSISLWEHYTNENKEKYEGYYQIGTYYLDVAIKKHPDPFIDFNDPELYKLPLQYLNIAMAKDSINGRHSLSVTANILVNMGTAYGMINQYEMGIKEFTKALTILPGLKVAYENRAWFYSNMHKNDSAINDYNRYEKLDTTNDLVYFRRSVCEGNIQLLNDGLRDINKAILINNTNAEYYVVRANFYKALNVPDAMHADAQRARDMGANVPAELLE